MNTITIFDKSNIEQFSRKKEQDGTDKREYLYHCTRNKLCSYILNAGNSEMSVVEINNKILLPVITNRDLHFSQCYILSPYGHYIKYSLEEMQYVKSPIRRFLLKLTLRLAGLICKLFLLNKVVSINNWLFSTNFDFNPSPDLLKKVTQEMVKHFKKRALVIRSVNSLNKEKLDTLKAEGYTLIINREVHFWDPKKLNEIHKKKRKNVRQDITMIEKKGCRVSELQNPDRQDFIRLAELYKGLYYEKHSTLNPLFTPEFIEHVYRTKNQHFKILYKDDLLVGFVSLFIENGVIYPTMIGYDIELEQKEKPGLYRMIFGILFKDSIEKNLLLFLSSGAGSFKRNRGSFQMYEYEAVYLKHLPVFRKIPWLVLKKGIELSADGFYANSSV